MPPQLARFVNKKQQQGIGNQPRRQGGLPFHRLRPCHPSHRLRLSQQVPEKKRQGKRFRRRESSLCSRRQQTRAPPLNLQVLSTVLSTGKSSNTKATNLGARRAVFPGRARRPLRREEQSDEKHRGKRSSRALLQEEITSIPWVANVGETAEGREWKREEGGERLVESGERP